MSDARAQQTSDDRQTDGRDEVEQPAVIPPGPWEFATPMVGTLANGLRLVAYDIPGQYVISVRTVVPFPLSAEPREFEGVAAIMARMLDEGTAEHTSEQFAELLERKGIALGAGVNEAGLSVDLDVPKAHLDEALDLLRQVLADPVFPQPELDRHLRTRLAEIEQELNSVKDALRAQVGSLAVSGAEKILGASIDQNAHAELVNKLAAEI